MYLNLPCNAFQTTLATYAGQNIGAGKLDRVNLGVRQPLSGGTDCLALVWAS